MVPCIIIFYEITNRCNYMQSISFHCYVHSTFRVPYTPIIRSTIFQLYSQPLVQTIVSSELLAPSVAWYKIVLLMMCVYGTRNM